MQGRECSALLDTGTSVSVPGEEFLRRVKAVCTANDGHMLSAANGSLMLPIGQSTLRVPRGSRVYVTTFVVVPYCSDDATQSWDFLSSDDVIIECFDGTLSLRVTSFGDDDSAVTSYCLCVVDDAVNL